MNAATARYWYRHLQHIVGILDGLNTDGDKMYTAGNEGIRRIAQEMTAHTEDKTATAEMPAVELEAGQGQ